MQILEENEIRKNRTGFVDGLAKKNRPESIFRPFESKVTDSKKLSVKKTVLIFSVFMIVGGSILAWYFTVDDNQRDSRVSLEEFKKTEPAENLSESMGSREGKNSSVSSSSGESENTPAFLEETAKKGNLADIPKEDEQQKSLDFSSANKNESQKSELTLKIIGKGASAESVQNAKNLLAGKGYAKIETKNASVNSIIENTIFYREDKFMREAQLIKEVLLNEGGIFSYPRKAETGEEKNADITIILGKYKDALPN